MAHIESLLGERLEGLRREWAAVGGSSPDPVLREQDLPALLAATVRAGGKRLRPRLVCCGWLAAGGAVGDPDVRELHRLAAALELLHVFGLVQDDVMDGSTLRRGRAAVHVTAAAQHRAAGGVDDADRFGQSVAILVGDLAHAEADFLVGGQSRQVRELWRRTCVELVRGQSLDLSTTAWSSTAAGDGSRVSAAREVAHAKSGAYSVQRPLELGATLLAAGPELLTVLTRYGALVGEAFAVRDDLLGIFGSPEVTGKPDGDDLRSAKSTVLLAMLEERATGRNAAAVARMRRQRHDERDTARVRDAMVEVGVRDDAERRIDVVSRQAVALLDPAIVHPDACGELRRLAEEVAWRSW